MRVRAALLLQLQHLQLRLQPLRGDQPHCKEARLSHLRSSHSALDKLVIDSILLLHQIPSFVCSFLLSSVGPLKARTEATVFH